MATITLTKHNGFFVYDDYYKGRSALRIRELNSMYPAQNIKRSKSHNVVEAVLISKQWYDSRATAYSAVSAPTFKANYDLVADDYMGVNLTSMCNLIQSRPETQALAKKTALEGSTLNAFKAYSILGTKEFYRDDNEVVPFETSVKVGGDVRAYLIHPKHYQALNQAPVATVYAGTGNGTLSAKLCPVGAVSETITITAIDPTHFNVVGSVTGAMGVATVGTLFANTQIEISLTAGSIAFVAGDMFTVTSFAAY